MQTALSGQTTAGELTYLASRLFLRELERYLAPLGLVSAHMPVLLALQDGQALPQKTLAAHARVEQPTMTATLNRMARDGLIERHANPRDGHSTLVRLTPLAMDKLPAVHDVVGAINALMLEQLRPDEREQYFALLGRVVAVLEAQQDSAVAVTGGRP